MPLLELFMVDFELKLNALSPYEAIQCLKSAVN